MNGYQVDKFFDVRWSLKFKAILTSNSGSLSWTGNLSLLTVPFQGRNLVPFSRSPLVQMLNSEAKDGLSPISPGGVNLAGPKHSSSGQRTKVSIVCWYFLVQDLPENNSYFDKLLLLLNWNNKRTKTMQYQFDPFH